MLDPSIAFALLAAGRSSRFGGNKLAMDLGGKPLWHWAAEAAEAAGFLTRFLIVPPSPIAAMARDGWTVATNPDAATGMASSISCAATLAARHRRLVIGLADMPFVGTALLRKLALADGPAFTRYPLGKDGVPAAFPADLLPRLHQLEGDEGAARLDWGSTRESVVPVMPAETIDLDTPADLQRARAHMADLRRLS